MTAQILVIMRKEWQDSRSTLFSYTHWLAGLWPILLFCAAFGVYEPLRVWIGCNRQAWCSPLRCWCLLW
jgi:hypothetical protein